MGVEPSIELGPFSGHGATARPWAHTVDALRRSQKFTLVTVRADGRPHATQLLAIWTSTPAAEGMAFCTGAQEQKFRNLAANPHCILREGTASVLSDAGALDAVATAFEQAYGWHLTRPDGTWHRMGAAMRSGDVLTYTVRPTTVFAYGNGEPFSQTRYRFD